MNYLFQNQEKNESLKYKFNYPKEKCMSQKQQQ